MAASVDHYYMGQALRDRWNLKHVFTEPALGWQLDYSVAVLTSHPLRSAGRAAATIAFGAHEIEILGQIVHVCSVEGIGNTSFLFCCPLPTSSIPHEIINLR